jgi:hypothetical protein
VGQPVTHLAIDSSSRGGDKPAAAVRQQPLATYQAGGGDNPAVGELPVMPQQADVGSNSGADRVAVGAAVAQPMQPPQADMSGSSVQATPRVST